MIIIKRTEILRRQKAIIQITKQKKPFYEKCTSRDTGFQAIQKKKKGGGGGGAGGRGGLAGLDRINKPLAIIKQLIREQSFLRSFKPLFFKSPIFFSLIETPCAEISFEHRVFLKLCYTQNSLCENLFVSCFGLERRTSKNS